MSEPVASGRVASWSGVSLATLLAAVVGACDAFPENLRDKIPDADGGSMESGGDGPYPPVSVAPYREAELLFADSGLHRSFGVVSGSGDSDIVVWSSDAGAILGHRIRYCSSNDCAAPRELASKVCDKGGMSFSGYFASAGSKIFATNLRCAGYVCAFDPAHGSEEVSCGFGPSLRRLVGDSTGIFATSGARGGEGPPDVEIHSLDPAAVVGNLPEHPTIAVPKLATTGLADIALGPTKVYWAEWVDASGTFRVVACPRALAQCGEPRAILQPRAGAAVALAATDAEVFVALTSAGENEVVRVVPSGEVTTLAKVHDAVSGLALAGDFVYWSEGGSVRRCPRTGPCSPESIGRAPGTISHLVMAANGSTLYVLSTVGVYRLRRG